MINGTMGEEGRGRATAFALAAAGVVAIAGLLAGCGYVRDYRYQGKPLPSLAWSPHLLRQPGAWETAAHPLASPAEHDYFWESRNLLAGGILPVQIFFRNLGTRETYHILPKETYLYSIRRRERYYPIPARFAYYNFESLPNPQYYLWNPRKAEPGTYRNVTPGEVKLHELRQDLEAKEWEENPLPPGETQEALLYFRLSRDHDEKVLSLHLCLTIRSGVKRYQRVVLRLQEEPGSDRPPESDGDPE